MKKLFLIGVAGVVIACGALTPGVVRAAQLSFEVVSGEGTENNAAVIEVYVDPQAKELNVVEGAVSILVEEGRDLSVMAENGESVLKLWPTPPQYDAESHSIRFSGGSPQGFSDTSLIFRLRLQASAPGSVTMAWLGGMAYINDGKGTAEPISAKSLTVNLDAQSGGPNNAQSHQEGDFSGGIIMALIVALVVAFVYGYKKIFAK